MAYGPPEHGEYTPQEEPPKPKRVIVSGWRQAKTQREAPDPRYMKKDWGKKKSYSDARATRYKPSYSHIGRSAPGSTWPRSRRDDMPEYGNGEEKQLSYRTLAKRTASRAYKRVKLAAPGMKAAGKREAMGFFREVKSEGVKSAYKTQRTLEMMARRKRQPRTRIIQRREVMPGSPSLGERAVMEASMNYVPVLDRNFFGYHEEAERNLIGAGARDMSNLVTSAEQNFKKKEQKYY